MHNLSNYALCERYINTLCDLIIKVCVLQKPHMSARTDRILDKAVTTGTLSSSGKDFLVAALDPFHDSQLKDLQGWPDLETTSSVVRLIKQTINISTNQGTNPWDCYIDLFPWLNRLNFTHTNSTFGGRVDNTVLYDPATTPVNYGGLTVSGVASGATVDWSTLNDRINGLSLPNEFAEGTFRIVGIGFEVTNTTAELYKQGQALVYRQPNPSPKPCAFKFHSNDGAGIVDRGTYTCVEYNVPPSNAAQTMLLPGTRSWAAEEGCYVVGTFVGQDNPPVAVNYTCPVMQFFSGNSDTAFNQPAVPAAPITNASNLIIPLPLAPTIKSRVVNAAQPTLLMPIHMCGARFIGLSPQTTLAVTLNMYVESFPTVAEEGILVLATPSAQYDPVALEIFSHALTYLPVGVPVAENGLGEWFKKAMQFANDYIAPVTDLFGVPLASKAIRGGNKLASQYITSPSPMAKPPTAKMLEAKKKDQKKTNMKK